MGPWSYDLYRKFCPLWQSIGPLSGLVPYGSVAGICVYRSSTGHY